MSFLFHNPKQILHPKHPRFPNKELSGGKGVEIPVKEGSMVSFSYDISAASHYDISISYDNQGEDGTLGLFAYASKKLRPSYAAWFIAYFAIAIGTTWLLSGPRYLLAMPVVAMMLALVTEKRWQQWLAALILVPLSILYLIAFICRWQVW